jgi:O-antigen/teichoic acid export membrane protein
MGVTDFIAGLCNFLLVLVFVQLSDRGAIGLIYARVISLSLSCAYAYFATPVKKRLEFHPQALKEMLVFGFPLQINDILGFAFQRIDTLILGVLLGPAEVAYYEIARRIPDSLARLYEAFRSVYYAFLSRLFGLQQQDKAAQLLNNSTRLVSFASILGALLALLFGRDIIILLFSEYYLASVPAFVLLMIALGISLVGNILGTSLVAVGESGKPAIIPVLGTAGAALATLCGTCATNPLNVMFLRRRKVDVRVRAYLKPIVILGAFGLLVLVVKPTGLLQKGSVIVLFISACMFLSVVTREDLVALCGEARLTVFNLARHLPSRSTRV